MPLFSLETRSKWFFRMLTVNLMVQTLDLSRPLRSLESMILTKTYFQTPSARAIKITLTYYIILILRSITCSSHPHYLAPLQTQPSSQAKVLTSSATCSRTIRCTASKKKCILALRCAPGVWGASLWWVFFGGPFALRWFRLEDASRLEDESSNVFFGCKHWQNGLM